MSGPSLPAKIARQLGTDILIASAMLADLVAQGKLRASHLKVGGSPLYYVPGQEDKLYNFAAGNLNPKDLQVLEQLKENKVIRESAADLLTKVAVRSLQDFAVPLQVTLQGRKEIFWKWKLFPMEESREMIKKILGIAEAGIPETGMAEASVPETRGAGTGVPETVTREAAEPKPVMAETGVPSLNEPETKTFEKKTGLGDFRKIENRGLDSREAQYREAQYARQLAKEKAEQPINQMPPPEALHRKLSSPELLSTQFPAAAGMSLRRHRKPLRKVPDGLFQRAEDYFRKLAIEIEQKETVRKNAELNFVILVPSAVGKMKYFCKVKLKRRCDEKDLSAAYMEAQVKKLPLLFLYAGEMGRKAQEMLESGVFENVMIQKV